MGEICEKYRPHHTATTNYTFVVLTISRSEAEVNLLVPLAGGVVWSVVDRWLLGWLEM